MTNDNTNTIEVGTLKVAPIGTGTWAWGDALVWGYRRQNDGDFKAAYNASIAAGIFLFDTAELYGFGRSEHLLAQFRRQNPNIQPVIATKFLPYPWRRRKESVIQALQKSLRRLEIPAVDLYQIHWAGSRTLIENWAEGLAAAVQLGLTRNVGVSNYSVEQMRLTHNILAKYSIKLASNQVEYSLIERSPERSGLLNACRELGITLIAYSPLGMGLLTGKFTPDNPPKGIRGRWFSSSYIARLQPLIAALREIGTRYKKTPAQVALNWAICKGTLPIPGAKNVQQLQENAGALGWRLANSELLHLDTISATLQRA